MNNEIDQFSNVAAASQVATAPIAQALKQNMFIWGLYIWGGLYAAGVFVAALTMGNHIALYLVLISAGFAYLAQFAGVLIFEPRQPVKTIWRINAGCTLIAIVTGIAAGLALIF